MRLVKFFTLALVGILFACETNTPSTNPSQTEVKQDRCEGNALGYLHSLMTGDSVAAAGFWKPGIAPKTLFTVQNFHIISHGPFLNHSAMPYKPPRVYYKLEVESSTKGGFPIRKRWNIVMEPGSKNFADWDCAIVDLVEGE
jgi:hypothetical protein